MDQIEIDWNRTISEFRMMQESVTCLIDQYKEIYLFINEFTDIFN